VPLQSPHSFSVMINQLQIGMDLHASCREILDSLAFQLSGGTGRNLFSVIRVVWCIDANVW